MEFTQTLSSVAGAFEAADVRYAIIGGVALGFLGDPRATLDIDFLVHRDDLDKVEKTLVSFGYHRIFQSENVSRYQHSEARALQIDLIHAFRRHALSMLDRAASVSVGEVRAKVASVEDVIGLKVQSMANDPSRKTRDLADIESLVERRGKELDWRLIGEYFILFGMQAELDRLKRRLDRAQ